MSLFLNVNNRTFRRREMPESLWLAIICLPQKDRSGKEFHSASNFY